MNKGDFAGTEAELHRCLELAADLGSHRVRGRGDVVARAGHIRTRRPSRGRATLPPGPDMVRAHRPTRTFKCRTSSTGWRSFALADGRPEEAEAYLREAVPVALQIGGWVLIDTYRHLVYALVALDRIDDAARSSPSPPRNLPEEDAYARSSLLLAEAVVATAAGEQAAAATSFAEALRLIEELDIPLDLAKARMLLGRSLHDVRRRHRRTGRARASARDLRPHRRDDATRRDRPRAGGARGGAGCCRPLHG